ncbi:MAG: type II toxin-antitoxin system VapC family toxin [Candidatus Helarchaeota archaeon]
MKISLDTNIFLNVKNKEKPFYIHSKKILDSIDEGKLECIISIINLAELCVGYYRNNEINDKDEFLKAISTNNNYKIINLDLNVADKAAEVKNQLNLKLPDSIIIATALKNNASVLITNDSKLEKAKNILEILTSEDFTKKYSNMVI